MQQIINIIKVIKSYSVGVEVLS